MSNLKKYYLLAGCICLTSILFTLVISAKSATAKEVTIAEKTASFLDSVKELHKQELLDGEVLIAQGKEVLLNLQSPSIASSDTSKGPQFMIGSVSKQFFAVSLLKSLYDSSPYDTEELKIADVKSKLHLPLSHFLPKERELWDGHMPTWAQEVSLHHLLTHTSGIQSYTDTGTDAFGYSSLIDSGKRWFEIYHSPKDIIQLILKDPLSFPPGSQFAYCNTGYVLIAEAIEAITSLPASQYLQETLFDQISLTSTTNPVQGRWDELRLNPALSRLTAPFQYDPRGNQMDIYPLLHCEDISVAKGAGSIISTSSDLLKWNQSLHKEKSILPKELYTLFITPDHDNYGYGIGIEKSGIGSLLGHTGGIGSYRTFLLYIPEQDLSIILSS